MLRAVRFTARLGFELHSATRAACVELAEQVASVSPERIREELSRMLADESRGTAIKLLTELRLLEHVLPEVHALHGVARAHCSCAGGDAFEHVLATVARLRPDASCEAAWGALLHDVGLPLATSEAAEGATFVRHEAEGATIARSMLKRLRMGNRETDRIVTLVRDHRIAREAPGWRLSKLRQVLAHPAFEDLVDVARAEGDSSDECTGGVAFLQDARLRWGTELPPPLLTGDDLLAAGVARGPALGRVLDAIRAEQLDEQIATREQALLRARELAADA